MLWLTQERIEEVRAWMNTTLGQTIDNLEMERGNALEGQRAREQRAVKAVQARMRASSSPKKRPTSTQRRASPKS